MLTAAAPASGTSLASGVDQIALRLGVAAQAMGRELREVLKMVDAGELAYVRLPIAGARGGRRGVVVLQGDLWAVGAVRPTIAESGRSMLAHWLRRRERLSLEDIAAAFDVSRQTVWRLADAGTMPASFDGRAWSTGRDQFVRWLLRLRVPPSWEVCAP